MSRKKSNKEELYKLSAVEIYKLVLEGKKLKKFPMGFWQQPEANTNAIELIKYFIEDYLKLSDEEVKEKFSAQLLKHHKLGGLLGGYFHGSPYEAINSAYPNKFKPWEFKMSPMGYWECEDNVINATKWLIEEKLKLSDDELRKQLSQKLFHNNNLRGMLATLGDSPYKAVNLAYPGKFKPWEFKQVSMGYWHDTKNGIKATKWLIEEKLELSDDELKEQLSYDFFIQNGLKGMITQCFNDSPYDAINSCYPNKFKPWEFKNCSINYWSKDTGIEATKWLIEDKLKFKKEDLNKVTRQTFIENGLSGMLYTCFNNNPKTAIKEYMNRFQD